MCPHVKIINYKEPPVCEVNNGICPYMRRCTTQMTWLPLNGMNGCKIKESFGIPKGAHKVRFKKHGMLYVEYGDHVITIPYEGEDTPAYVFLTKRNGVIKLKKGDNAK